MNGTATIAYGIAPGLYQGPLPSSTAAVRADGFSVLVLCAVEAQPPVPPDGLVILRCPLVDDTTRPIPEPDWQRAVATAREITGHLGAGRRVLTTCLAGLNRSGLVNALVLAMRYGMSGNAAVERVRLCRGDNALFNAQFVSRLSRIQPNRSATAR